MTTTAIITTANPNTRARTAPPTSPFTAPSIVRPIVPTTGTPAAGDRRAFTDWSQGRARNRRPRVGPRPERWLLGDTAQMLLTAWIDHLADGHSTTRGRSRT